MKSYSRLLLNRDYPLNKFDCMFLYRFTFDFPFNTISMEGPGGSMS